VYGRVLTLVSIAPRAGGWIIGLMDEWIPGLRIH
jgi:hypothetical protein